MKEKMLALSVVIFAYASLFLCLFFWNQANSEESMELLKQEFVITSIDTDLEGLEVKASIEYSEEESYNLVLVITNHTKDDLIVVDESVFFKKKEAWKERSISQNPTQMNLPIGKMIWGADKIEQVAQGMEGVDASVFSNVYMDILALWDKYTDMDSLGEYRYELHIKKIADDTIGTVWVEWIQQKEPT